MIERYIMKKIILLLVVALTSIISGCGSSAPTVKEFEELLERIRDSPDGRVINIQKEVDEYGKLSSEEQKRRYKEWEDSL